MAEHLLSPEILSRASTSGNEYGWPPEFVEAAINDARGRGIAVVGGQAQFRLPEGICELYWIDVDPMDRTLGESWDRWVHRAADETIAKVRLRMSETDWRLEIQSWEFLRVKMEAGLDVMAHLWFVLYFEANRDG